MHALQGRQGRPQRRVERHGTRCTVSRRFQETPSHDRHGQDIPVINACYLLTAKPIVYLANMSPDEYIKKKVAPRPSSRAALNAAPQNKWLKKLLEFTQSHGNAPLIPFSAALEQQLEAKTPEELKVGRNSHKTLVFFLTVLFRRGKRPTRRSLPCPN